MMNLRFVIMKMLSKKAMSGYALRKNLSYVMGKEVSSGAIYPALKTLTRNKIIVVNENVDSGRFKKTYSLTDKGRIKLKEEENIINKLLEIDRDQVKLEVVGDEE